MDIPAKVICRIAQPDAERAACQVASTDAAGVDADGRELTVVRLVLGAGAIADALAPHTPCVPQEVWLVRSKEGKILDHRRLLELCNNGYGAAGLGEDTLAVGPNAMVITQSGGSAWRWSKTTELQLSPLRAHAEYEEGSWTLGVNSGRSGWDWDRFFGQSQWTVPASCDNEDAVVSGVYSRIPRASVPAAAANAWREASLGGCALRVDASGAGGFVVKGEPGAASDAAMSVVFGEPTTLWIEVTDDHVVETAASWIHADHLEIWLGPGRNGFMEGCLPDGAGAVQWAIPLAGGPAIPAFGDPQRAPIVDRAGQRLRVQLAEPPGSITVVYSDSDDGLAQERLIATSALAFGDARTLGGVFEVRPERATCGVVDGRLEPVIVQGWSAR